jgi:hypothetical protein
MVVRLDPFQTIVNVSWPPAINRYSIVGFFDNGSDAFSGHVVPILPTTASMIISQLPEYNGALVKSNAYPDGIDGNDTLDEDKFNNDAINSRQKRKDLIDRDHPSYWLVTLQAWKDETFNDIHISQVGYFFFLGRYVIDHPNVNHFFFDATELFANINFTWDRPLTQATLLHTTDWSAPQPELDGGPFEIDM